MSVALLWYAQFRLIFRENRLSQKQERLSTVLFVALSCGQIEFCIWPRVHHSSDRSFVSSRWISWLPSRTFSGSTVFWPSRRQITVTLVFAANSYPAVSHARVKLVREHYMQITGQFKPGCRPSALITHTRLQMREAWELGYQSVWVVHMLSK